MKFRSNTEQNNKIRKRRLILNVIFNLLYEMVMVIYGFVLPKLYISYYGSEANGLMSSITKFLGFVSICELGVGTVVTSNLYKPLVDKDWESVSRIVASGKKFYRVIAIILSLYTLSLTFIYPNFVSSSYSPFYVISMILIISISSFAQYFFGITYTLVLKADQRDYINNIINCTSVVLNLIFCSLFIVNGATIHMARGVTSIIYILRPLILMWYVKKRYPINTKIKYEGEPIKQKWNGLAQHIAYIVQDNTDTIVLTFFSTLQYVSVYSVYYNVVNGVKKIVNSVNPGMSALLGNLYASKEIDHLKKTFAQYEWLMHSAATYFFGVTAVLITPFINVYTKGVTDANYSQPLFGVLLSIAIMFWAYQRPYNMMIQAALKYKETQIYSIIEPLINISISILLVKSIGLVGVAIGTIISMAYRMICLMYYLTKDVLFLNKGKCVKRIFTDCMMFLMIYLSCIFIKLQTLSYFSWIIMAVEVSVFALIVCFVINLILYKENTFGLINKLKNKIEVGKR